MGGNSAGLELKIVRRTLIRPGRELSFQREPVFSGVKIRVEKPKQEELKHATETHSGQQ